MHAVNVMGEGQARDPERKENDARERKRDRALPTGLREGRTAPSSALPASNARQQWRPSAVGVQLLGRMGHRKQLRTRSSRSRPKRLAHAASQHCRHVRASGIRVRGGGTHLKNTLPPWLNLTTSPSPGISAIRPTRLQRFGKFNKILEPGLAVLIPFVDRIRYVQSLKENAVEIPTQAAITQDNVTLEIDGVLYYRIEDPYK
ncbi:hypothetical protein BC830DRAFT_1222946, partial [Chytriomyces sp. MP71]